jgi:pimeloyl-ACP methyl ester carboxylesterase
MSDERRTGSLPAPGAVLHYKVRGEGPWLLMLQGGDGDADGTDPLATQLIDGYTVLSYDRRGLSRSPIDDASARVDLSVHADDAARLISEIAAGPVLMFGSSLGALLGLELVSRRPRAVRLLVAHEPPATELLPAVERDQAVQAQTEVEEVYRREGIGAAMRQFMTIAGIDFADREPEVEIPRPNPDRIANLEFFLTHDAPAARRYQLNLPALRAATDRIIPAAGQNSTTFPQRCARALAAELGRPLAELPGGHSGFVFRPRAFAAQLRTLLAIARDGEH